MDDVISNNHDKENYNKSFSADLYVQQWIKHGKVMSFCDRFIESLSKNINKRLRTNAENGSYRTILGTLNSTQIINNCESFKKDLTMDINVLNEPDDNTVIKFLKILMAQEIKNEDLRFIEIDKEGDIVIKLVEKLKQKLTKMSFDHDNYIIGIISNIENNGTFRTYQIYCSPNIEIWRHHKVPFEGEKEDEEQDVEIVIINDDDYV